MSNLWNKIEFRISQHFACALEYGDFSDLTEDEQNEFQQWLECEQDGKTGHWTIDEISEDYGKCEVTGLFSNLMQVSFNYKD